MKRGGGGKRNKQTKKQKTWQQVDSDPSMSENGTISSGCILVKEVGIVLS